MKRVAATLSAIVAVTFVVAGAALLLTPYDALKGELEVLLDDALGKPVRIGTLRWALYPRPVLVAQDIQVGEQNDDSGVRIGSVCLYVDLNKILEGELIIPELQIEGLTMTPSSIDRILAKNVASPEAPPPVKLTFRHISASPIKLATEDGGSFGPYEMTADFSDEGVAEIIRVSRLDRRLQLQLETRTNALSVQARNWRLPVAAPIHFESLSLHGVLGEKQLWLSDLQAKLHEGRLEATGQISWEKGWRVEMDARLAAINLDSLPASFQCDLFSGQGYADGHVKLAAQDPGNLFANPQITADVMIRDGTLNNPGSPLKFNQMSFKGKLAGERLEIGGLNAQLYGGELRGNGEIAWRKGWQVVLNTRLTAINLSSFLTSFQSDLLSGQGYATGRIKLAAQDPANLFAHPRITAEVMIRDGALNKPGSPLKFERVDFQGKLADNRLEMSKLKARLYGGKLDGKGVLQWQRGWKLEIQGRLASVDVAPLMASFDEHFLSGRGYGTGKLELAASKAGRLPNRIEVDAEVLVRNGTFYKADLRKAAMSAGTDQVTGGETKFEQLGGRLTLRNGVTQITDMTMDSAAIKANGHLQVDSEEQLTGEIYVGIKPASAIVGIPIRLSGTPGEPKLRPTDAAIAGAAAGTAILPGVGTVVGANAGTIAMKTGKAAGHVGNAMGKTMSGIGKAVDKAAAGVKGAIDKVFTGIGSLFKDDSDSLAGKP